MGYTTEFEGRVSIDPPLNKIEAEYLRRFAASRRMNREAGPYYCEDDGQFGQTGAGGVIDYSQPGRDQPGLWCQWVPTDDLAGLEWDQGEKFYDAAEWMEYLIDHFLRPYGRASVSGDPQFVGFTFDHVVNGTINAYGERPTDRWRLVVKDNVVTVEEGVVTYHAAVEPKPDPIRVDATVGQPIREIGGAAEPREI